MQREGLWKGGGSEYYFETKHNYTGKCSSMGPLLWVSWPRPARRRGRRASDGGLFRQQDKTQFFRPSASGHYGYVQHRAFLISMRIYASHILSTLTIAPLPPPPHPFQRHAVEANTIFKIRIFKNESWQEVWLM